MSESRIPPESLSSPRSFRWMVGGTIVGLALLAGLLAAADGHALLAVARSVEIPLLAWPLLWTVASYAAMARSYQQIASLAGLSLRFGEMLRLTMISTAANTLLSTGGISGLAVRSYYFSRHHRLRWGNAVSVSLAQTFITNLVLSTFLFWGVLSLAIHGDPIGSSPFAALGLFLLALVLCIAGILVVASRIVRRALFGGLLTVVDSLSRPFARRRVALRARLALFEEELHEGVDFLIAQRRRMVGPLLYVCLDWVLMLATLDAAFACVGRPVAVHVLVIGFSTGVFLSTVNLVPGGIGVMEGSMAAVFAGLGVTLEAAVVATLIFRICYYVVPLLLTLFFWRDVVGAVSPSRRLDSASARRTTA